MTKRRPAFLLPATLLACAILTMGPHALPSGAAQPQPVAVHTYEEFLTGLHGTGIFNGYPTPVNGAYPGFWYAGGLATCAPIHAAPTCHVMGNSVISSADPFTSFEADVYSKWPSDIPIVGYYGNEEVARMRCPTRWESVHCRITAAAMTAVEVGTWRDGDLMGFDTAIFTRGLQVPPPPPVDGDVGDLTRRPLVLHVS